MKTRLSRLVFLLFCLFCVAYLITVIGVAFDVHPPFSMTWAASALLIRHKKRAQPRARFSGILSSLPTTLGVYLRSGKLQGSVSA